MTVPSGTAGSDGSIRRKATMSQLDHWLFGVLFGAGAIGIVLLKEFGHSQLLVTAWPASLLFVYAMYVFGAKRYRLREDRAGDSIYYLGFLYTLISLAYALYAFTQAREAAEHILTNFGIALSTTILGLAFRVLFNQMRDDPVEYERAARVELSEAVSRLRGELNACVVDVNDFRRGVVQALRDGVDEISKGLRTTLDGIAGDIADKAKPSVTRIEHALSGYADRVSELEGTAPKAVGALEGAIRRIEQLEIPADLIARKLERVVDDLAEQLRARLGAIEEAGQAAGALLHRIEGLAEKLGGLGSAIEGAEKRLSEDAQRYAGILSEIAKQAEGDVEFLNAQRTRLKAALDEQREIVARTSRTLASLAQLVIERLRGRRH